MLGGASHTWVSRPIEAAAIDQRAGSQQLTTNICTKILDFRGFDSGITLISRGGIPRPVGNVPESLSQASLVEIILVGRVGVIAGAPSATVRSRHVAVGGLLQACGAASRAFAGGGVA